ncbi:MAG: glutathione S-transferase family protein [Nevskiales bacterium]
MAIISPPNAYVKTLKGVHLYHAELSSCSQRVRVALAEKNIPWESHLVDIANDEHVTGDYPSINPKGVVPTLVHDGVVHVESADMLAYIEEVFDGPSLKGDNSEEALRWVQRCDAQQAAMKVTSFEFLFKPKARKTPEQLARFQRLQQHNPGLVAFHQQFSSKEGLPKTQISEAVARIMGDTAALDLQLAGQPWIAGKQFSLADAAWMINAHRYSLMGFPTRRFPNYAQWFSRARQRKSYRSALQNWEPKGVIRALGIYTAYRRITGTDFCAHITA